MTRQEAKRHVLGCVLAILTAGQVEEIVHDINDYPAEDQQRIFDALDDLQRELHRRAN